MQNTSLEPIVEAAWQTRDAVNAGTRGEIRDAVEAALELLDKGEARVAAKIGAL